MFNSSKVKVNSNIIASRNISFNNSLINSDSGKVIAICSENGNISINTSSCNLNGLIYAPNGTVTINCSSFDFKGSIIAKKIVIKGSKNNISSDSKITEILEY